METDPTGRFLGRGLTETTAAGMDDSGTYERGQRVEGRVRSAAGCWCKRP